MNYVIFKYIKIYLRNKRWWTATRVRPMDLIFNIFLSYNEPYLFKLGCANMGIDMCYLNETFCQFYSRRCPGSPQTLLRVHPSQWHQGKGYLQWNSHVLSEAHQHHSMIQRGRFLASHGTPSREGWTFSFQRVSNSFWPKASAFITAFDSWAFITSPAQMFWEADSYLWIQSEHHEQT